MDVVVEEVALTADGVEVLEAVAAGAAVVLGGAVAALGVVAVVSAGAVVAMGDVAEAEEVEAVDLAVVVEALEEEDLVGVGPLGRRQLLMTVIK